MLRLDCKVEIEREGESAITLWKFDRVENISITGDGDSLTDTCTIRLPKAVQWIGGEIPIRRGDSVRVYMGYNGELKLRFVGYVKDVSAKVPTTITCEDEMFRLKNRSAKRKMYQNISLLELLIDQLDGMSIKWDDSINNNEVKLGNLKVEATTVAGLLSDLKQNYGITSCFALVDDVPTFFSYVIFPGMRNNAGKFAEKKNIISNDLEYRRAEDVRVKIKGVSIQEDNSRIEYTEGDGEERVIYRYGLSMDQLKEAVRNELQKEKWSGLSGSFDTFGMPRIEKMDVVDLEVGNAKGRYQVSGVNVEFGRGGYRQKVNLKRKVADL